MMPAFGDCVSTESIILVPQSFPLSGAELNRHDSAREQVPDGSTASEDIELSSSADQHHPSFFNAQLDFPSQRDQGENTPLLQPQPNTSQSSNQLGQQIQTTPCRASPPQAERPLERWAVEVGKDTPRLLDFVLNEPEVMGGQVSLYLVFVMCDIPCAMGIAFRVSEMEERVATIHEKHIRKTVLNPLVREIRRKRRRVQVQGHVEREDKMDTGLCEAVKRLKISRLVITSRRGSSLRRKASDVFAEQCAKQLSEQGCSVMVLQQGSKKRSPGSSSFVVVQPSGSPGRSQGGTLGLSFSSSSLRSAFSPPHSLAHGEQAQQTPVNQPKPVSPPGSDSGLQAFRGRLSPSLQPAAPCPQMLPQLLQPGQHHTQHQPQEETVQQSSYRRHPLSSLEQAHEGSKRDALGADSSPGLSRTESSCSLDDCQNLNSKSTQVLKARALRSCSDSRLLVGLQEMCTRQKGGSTHGGLAARALLDGTQGEASRSVHEGPGSDSSCGSDASSPSAHGSLHGGTADQARQRNGTSLSMGSSSPGWEAAAKRAPVESLVHELQRLQVRLNAAHQEEDALKKSVEEAQDELKQANTQKEEESLRRVACEAELEIAKFQAQEASRTVAMLRSEVETARRAASEALAAAELAKREREMAQELQSMDQQPLDFRMYSFEELSASTDGWSGQRLILDGDSGLVYRGTVEGHLPVAIRVLKDPSAPGALEEFQKEVKLGSILRHPNLVLLMGCCMEPPCLVYEYMPQGSLHDRLTCQGGSSPLHWTTRFDILWDVCTALIHLHCRDNPIVHFDLKPSNVLLDRNLVAKLGDVGLARIMRSLTDNTISVPLGTLGYACPELLRSSLFCSRTDVYSLGMVVYDLLGGVRNNGRTKGLVNAMEEAVSELDLKRMSQLTDPSAKWPPELAMELARLARECTAGRRKDRPEVARGVMPWLERLRLMVEHLVQKEAEETRRRTKRLSSLASVVSLGSSGDEDDMSTERSIPESFRCPIKLELMERPVIAADGHTYEEEAIRKWLEGNDTSPVTNVPLLNKCLIPNHNLRSLITDWKERRLLHCPVRRKAQGKAALSETSGSPSPVHHQAVGTAVMVAAAAAGAAAAATAASAAAAAPAAPLPSSCSNGSGNSSHAVLE